MDALFRLRGLHGVEELKLSEKLAKQAQQLADSLAEMNPTKLEHSDSEEYGENLVVRVYPISGKQATLHWYSEIAYYNFDMENQLECGHFTQIIWSATKEAGFGYAKTEDGHHYIVGHYEPPGNYTDEFIENVPRPVSGVIYVPSDEQIGIRAHIQLTAPKDSLNNPFAEDLGDYDPEKVVAELPNLRKESEDSILREVQGIDDVLRNANTRKDSDRSQMLELKVPESLLIENGIPTSGQHKGSKHYHINVKKVTRRFLKADLELLPIEDDVRFYDPNNNKELKIDCFEKLIQKRTEPEVIDYEDLDDFRRDVFEYHNQVRHEHGVSDLVRNAELDEMAQQWADKLARDGSPSYSYKTYNGSLLGENVALRFTVHDFMPASMLIDKWLNAADNYNYEREPTDEEIREWGHYTQVVWKNSKEIGIGRAQCSKLSKAFVVIFYHPPGNLRDQFVENVPSKSNREVSKL
ncbi:hypothetical protein Ciccas_008393 [Cichlidogyrus casuarinus]|uniref:SCP domain-containing protein n=1 Tax=Cichlidogyrus casuarinus TaxID=1844966 RepID=A0ABD2Q026_9PLAT